MIMRTVLAVHHAGALLTTKPVQIHSMSFYGSQL